MVILCASCASHLKHNYPVLLGDDTNILAKTKTLTAKFIDFSSFAHDILGIHAVSFTGQEK